MGQESPFEIAERQFIEDINTIMFGNAKSMRQLSTRLNHRLDHVALLQERAEHPLNRHKTRSALIDYFDDPGHHAGRFLPTVVVRIWNYSVAMNGHSHKDQLSDNYNFSDPRFDSRSRFILLITAMEQSLDQHLRARARELNPASESNQLARQILSTTLTIIVRGNPQDLQRRVLRNPDQASQLMSERTKNPTERHLTRFYLAESMDQNPLIATQVVPNLMKDFDRQVTWFDSDGQPITSFDMSQSSDRLRAATLILCQAVTVTQSPLLEELRAFATGLLSTRRVSIPHTQSIGNAQPRQLPLSRTNLLPTIVQGNDDPDATRYLPSHHAPRSAQNDGSVQSDGPRRGLLTRLRDGLSRYLPGAP